MEHQQFLDILEAEEEEEILLETRLRREVRAAEDRVEKQRVLELQQLEVSARQIPEAEAEAEAETCTGVASVEQALLASFIFIYNFFLFSSNADLEVALAHRSALSDHVQSEYAYYVEIF